MSSVMTSSTSLSLIGRLRDETTRDAAWREFVARYGGLLYHWCRQWGLQASDAEDTAQETLLIILQEIQGFELRPDATFRGWMRTIAQNAWYRLIHRRDRRREDPVETVAGLAARDDLIERFEAMARDELVERAMSQVQAQVDPLAWRAFVLTSLEQRPGVEVAIELGQTPSWVYQARSRIRKQIRQAFAELDREE